MLNTDYDLKSSEIQQISNANALAGMFAALGYDVDTRLTQTPEAMGFPESLAREVKRIERIADHEQGALQVYLVEMKHVTVKLTQDLARVFRSRAGLFLLVLTTTDYERLDFVLLEQVAPTGSQSGIGTPQATLRPRILSVERRNPDRVSLRVLRRFSYTELDADYQWDKLRSAYGVAEWSEPLFNNRALFSDYYLNERLPQRDEWKEDPRPAYRALGDLMVEARQKYATQPEEMVRANLLEPVFKILGWAWESGKHARDESLEPDYWLSTTSGERVPCLAYSWDRALDGVDEKRDLNTPMENPAQTVVSILERMDAESSGWAIVTNGKTWRLYSARAHSRATNYYEIDLEETLASPDLADAFRYFWLFFRAKSLTPTPLPQGEGTGVRAEKGSFLDSLLTESASYAKALGDRLKENIFEEVFPWFAEGFIKNWGKPAVQLSDEELSETFHATLTFLYRLLFLLYAESRDLLPVKETRGYWEVSLSRMKQEIAHKAGDIVDLADEKLTKTYSSNETNFYDRLSELFAIVDQGKPDLNMPMYNGGLFVTFEDETLRSAQGDIEEAEELRAARFLAAHKIPDRYLALGLDKLARSIDEKTQSLAMIDYKSLGVRQLGSIYEGLLEFKLRVAREKMAVVQGKKGEQIVPYKEAVEKKLKIKSTGRGAARTESVIQKGEVYLETDKHERKASGSYYTPDYIVKYIVQHTVGPALEAKCEALRPKLREAQKAYHAAVERQKAFQKMGQKGDDPEKTAFTFASVVDDLFDLRVLDPAMGSGHFLVEAVDFITDRLLAFLNAFPWNPVTAALRKTRQTILEEMQRQGVSIDPARLTDVNLLKRHVLKRCIYGVDLNPMAVELAKVSLWLDCFTLGAPLSFLDHHLKCGNSLIGARVTEVREVTEKGQMSLFGSNLWASAMLATDQMIQVGMLSDVTASQVRESRTAYHNATDALKPFKTIMDVYVSRWFGNDIVKGKNKNPDVDKALDFLRSKEGEKWLFPGQTKPTLNPEQQQVAKIATKASREKRFFHWELEFPEVFFGASKNSAQEIVLKENAGFDAVVGNPPYIRVELLPQELKDYLAAAYSKVAIGRPDIYIFFAYWGTELLRNSGFISFITPGKFTTREHGLGLRKYWATQNRVLTFLDLAKCASMFPDATVYPCVFVVEHSEPTGSEDTVVAVAQLDVPENLIKLHKTKTTFSSDDGFGYVIKQAELAIPPDYAFDLQSDLNKKQVLSKITSVSVELEIISDTRQGIIAGDVSKYVLSREDVFLLNEKQQKLIKPLVSGKHIQRYCALESQQVIIYDIERLVAPRERSIFERPKFVMQDMSDRMEATLDFENYYCMDTTTLGFMREGIQYDLRFILSILNSRLTQFFMMQKFSGAQLRGGYLRFRPQFVEKLPIRHIDFTTPTVQRKALAHKVITLVSAGDSGGALSFVDACLSAQPEASDVVHDLLANLAERMIELNQQKQAEMKRLLGWLEGVLKVSVDELTGKSKVRNYIGDYQKDEPELTFAELDDILFKNKRKLGVSLSDSRLMAKVRDEYEKSLEVLRPIKSALKWTDDLIDQVVYRLYGLTEEEIAIVEGRK